MRHRSTRIRLRRFSTSRQVRSSICSSNFVPLAPALRKALRARGIAGEPMATGAAARTYNILLGEKRRVAAALIAAP